MTQAHTYAFGPHMAAILGELDDFTNMASLSGWWDVLHDLRQARHTLEGVGAVMDGRSASVEGSADGIPGNGEIDLEGPSLPHAGNEGNSSNTRGIA